MKWIKLLKTWTQKGLEGADDKEFEKDSVIEVEESIAKSLIDLNMAEEAEEPKEEDIEKTFKNFGEKLQTQVEDILTKSFESMTEKAEKGLIFSVPKSAEEKELRGFKDEGHFMKCALESARSAKLGIPPDVALVGGQEYMDLLAKAPSGQNVQNDSEGGFLVPEVTSNRIWTNMDENPLSFLPRTDRWETSGDSLKIPKMNETSRKTGLRHAGIQVFWLDEADELTVTKATVGRHSMDLHKLGAVVYFTEEQLNDAPAAWNNRVKRLVPNAIMFQVNYDFLWGSGVGKPKGIIGSSNDALICIPATDRNGNAQGNHTILHWNLSQLYWKNINRDTSVWVVHPDLAQQLEFIYFDDDSTNKRLAYSPINRGVTTPGPQLFIGPYGLPMFVHEMAADFGTKGDISLLDFSSYSTLSKIGGGVKQASSIHVRFLFEETAFRYTFRVGGETFWTSPKEDLHGDTNRGPFTTLASRTGGGTSSGL